jgi:AcrR family transcriptional regulator
MEFYVLDDRGSADDAAKARYADDILTVVSGIVEVSSCDEVRIRDVARLAQVSPRTIYELYPNRDALVVAGVAHWMARHRFSDLDALTPDMGAPLFDRLMPMFEAILRPWEQHPRMLEAFFWARTRPGGNELVTQGGQVIIPIAREAVADIDADAAHDIFAIMTDVVYACMGRVSSGDMPVTDILPTVERALARLTRAVDVSSPSAYPSRSAGRRPRVRGAQHETSQSRQHRRILLRITPDGGGE